MPDVIRCVIQEGLKEYAIDGNGELVVKLGVRSPRTFPVSSFTSARLTAGFADQVKLLIEQEVEGQRRALPTLWAPAGEASFLELVEALRVALPRGASFLDEVSPVLSALGQVRRYGLVTRSFGRTLGRNGTLFVWWFFSFLALPLLVAIYLTATGGYRLITDGQGLTIRRFRGRRLLWSDLRAYEVEKREQWVHGIRGTNFFRFSLHASAGKPEVLLSGRDGWTFLAELQARGVPRLEVGDDAR